MQGKWSLKAAIVLPKEFKLVLTNNHLNPLATFGKACKRQDIQQIPCICGTVDSVASPEKMKAYSIEFRKKIVKAYEQGDTSVRKVAQRFDVSKAFVQKILKQKQTTGHVQPKKQGGSLKSVLHSSTTQLTQMVEKYPDSTLSEYCEYWLDSHKQSVSSSMMCRELIKQNLTRKKKQYGVVNLPLTECNF